MLSGYRSSIAIGLFLLLIIFFRDLRWKGVFTLIPLGIFALAIAVVLQLAIGLPPIIQRGLTFIPIEWDAATAADAQGSLDFRKEVAEEWQENIFPKHPFFGRGFGLHMDDMMATLPFLSMDGYLSPTMTRNEAFAIGGHLHHGLRSVVDRFGIVGGIFFLIWIGALLRRAYNYLKNSRGEPLNPPLQWLTIYLIAFTILYLPGALRIESFLPQQLFLVGLFYALSRASGIDLSQKDKKTVKSIVPAFEVPVEDQPRARFQSRRLRGQA
jgi:O-antigen ligase